MLLEKYRSIGLQIVVLFTLINTAAFVGIYAITDLSNRFIVLLLMIGCSSLALEMCNQIIRIEPVTALYQEWTDTQLLEALFEKPVVSAATGKKDDQSLAIGELPLDNYLFLGERRQENRNKFLSAFQIRYPQMEVFDSNDSSTKDKFLAILSERRSNNLTGDKSPIIFLSSKFDPKIKSFAQLGIYTLLESLTDYPINLKVVDNAIARQLHPTEGERITFGLWDTSKGKIYQLRG